MQIEQLIKLGQPTVWPRRLAVGSYPSLLAFVVTTAQLPFLALLLHYVLGAVSFLPALGS